ncbi:hypothetical protein [Nocardioides bigeumensis]|uniref:Uncharacterized protein n=1 Tax=Nocardioides bigeumensis TaxID=433657 RepID=A0ABN2Y4M4_9ACTN
MPPNAAVADAPPTPTLVNIAEDLIEYFALAARTDRGARAVRTGRHRAPELAQSA